MTTTIETIPADLFGQSLRFLMPKAAFHLATASTCLIEMVANTLEPWQDGSALERRQWELGKADDKALLLARHAVIVQAEQLCETPLSFTVRCATKTAAHDFAFLHRLHMMTKLTFYGCDHLTDSIVIGIVMHCSRLTAVEMIGCPHITDASVAVIVEQCASLSTFMCGACGKLTDGAAASIAQFGRTLTFLDLSVANVTDNAVACISDSKCCGEKLVTLELLGTACQAPRFVNFAALENLSLAGCQSLLEPHLLTLPSLAKFSASRCERLQALRVENCASLVDVCLKDCKSLLDAELESFVRSCPNLTALELVGCRRVTDGVLDSLALHCPKLTTLTATSFVSPHFRNFQSLTTLSLVASHYLLSVHFDNCDALRTLNLGGSPLKDAALERLPHEVPQLTELDLYGCMLITDKAIEPLAQMRFLRRVRVGSTRVTLGDCKIGACCIVEQ